MANINLNGKIVVITGAAGLLGKEFCKSILDNGGNAVITDKNIDSVNVLLDEFPSQYHDKIDFFSLDITSSDSINKCIEYITQKHGRIDAIVNNAYPRNNNYGKKFFNVKYDDFCQNINMHIGGYFLVSQLFAQYFVKQKEGNIINMSSIYGVVAPDFEIYKNENMTLPVEYAAIKAAIIHLTKYMAAYLKKENIRVNSISPGGIFDNQPKGFLDKYNDKCLTKGMLDKKDISGALIFLLSDMSQYINGQNIIVDDGFTL